MQASLRSSALRKAAEKPSWTRTASRFTCASTPRTDLTAATSTAATRTSRPSTGLRRTSGFTMGPPSTASIRAALAPSRHSATYASMNAFIPARNPIRCWSNLLSFMKNLGSCVFAILASCFGHIRYWSVSSFYYSINRAYLVRHIISFLLMSPLFSCFFT